MHIPLFQHERTYYAAFQVRSIFMVGALGEYARHYASNPDAHLQDTLHRNIEFINTLLQQSDERFTYDFRTISRPNPSDPNQGEILLHIICAIKAPEAEAQDHAQSMFQLLNAQFTDLRWQVCADVAAIIDPWSVRHAASLTRRSEFTALPRASTMAQPSRLHLGMPDTHSQPDFFYVHNFLLSTASPHTLYSFLLQHQAPVAVSIRFQRSALTPAEVEFCRTNVNEIKHSEQLNPVEYQSLIERKMHMHHTLQKQQHVVALMTIDIVSAQPIPTLLLTMVGNLLTQSNSMNEYRKQQLNANAMGGYHVVNHSDYRGVADAFRTVRVHLPAVAQSRPHDRLPYLYDVSQAAIVSRLPSSSLVPLPGVEMQSHRQLRPPRDLSPTGTIIGEYTEAGIANPIRISEIDRTRHSYIIGQTGTGKSTVLKSMILDDIAHGRGVCAIDPHGDLINEIIAQIPAHRQNDVIIIDPMQTDAPVGINVFEYDTQAEREQVIQLFEAMMTQLFSDKGMNKDHTGPAFHRYLRNNAYWVTQDSNDPGTVIEFYQMMEQSEYFKRWYPIDENDAKLVSWREQLTNQDFHRMSDGHISWTAYINSKFEDFIFDTRIRLIFGQKRSTVNFYEAMNTQKIILVNLSRGLLNEIASAFVGYIVLAKLQQAALKRAELPHHQRPLFAIYVDEFQNYTTESFVSLLSESRKYGIALTLANQFLSQIENKRIVHAIIGNVGTVIAFRVGIADGEVLKPRFAPEVSPDDLINLPNWQAYVSTQVRGQSRRPFSMHTIRPVEHLDQVHLATVMQLSKQNYGTARAEIDRIIQGSMQLTRTAAASTATSSATTQTRDTHKDTVELIVPYDQAASERLTTYIDSDPQIMLVLHGLGMCIWKSGDHVAEVNQIGLPPQYMTALKETRLDGMPNLVGPNKNEQLHTVITDHQLVSVDDLQRYVLFYDNQTAQQKPDNTDLHGFLRTRTRRERERNQPIPVPLFLDMARGILGYFAHTYRPSAPIVDMAIFLGMGIFLDSQGNVTVWCNSFMKPNFTLSSVQAIATTDSQCFVLYTDGRVQRLNPTPQDFLTDLPAIRSISAGRAFAACIDHAGQCHFIGANDRIQQNIPAETFQAIACGYDHVVGLTSTGQVMAWGRNDKGNTDLPDDVRHSPRPFIKVAAGYDQSYAIRDDGVLYAWGDLHTQNLAPVIHGQPINNICITREQTFFQRRDGHWVSNLSVKIPFTINERDIHKIGSDGNHVMYVLLAPGSGVLQAYAQLAHTPLSAVPGIATETLQVLHALRYQQVADVLKMTHAAFTPHAHFQQHPDALTAFFGAIVAYLATHHIPANDWPEQAFDIKKLAPAHPKALWYREACGMTDNDAILSAQPEEQHTHRGDGIDFDDDFFADLDSLFKDDD